MLLYRRLGVMIKGDVRGYLGTMDLERELVRYDILRLVVEVLMFNRWHLKLACAMHRLKFFILYAVGEFNNMLRR
jgi:hypothetical protein